MKIGGINGFKIISEGLSIQRKKMNIIAENIANADSVRTADGNPYQKKYLSVVQLNSSVNESKLSLQNSRISLSTSNPNHFKTLLPSNIPNNNGNNIVSDEMVDGSQGDIMYMPEHPDANSEGYVQMTNVNIINEMTDMIAASRSYEANLTALNASKQMAKDALEI